MSDEIEADQDSERGRDERTGCDTARIRCPYCGEIVEIQLDPETHGELVQDCEVCCNPWQLTIEWTRDGRPIVRAEVV